MSDGRKAPDLSGLIGLLTENPALLAEIRGLIENAQSAKASEERETETAVETAAPTTRPDANATEKRRTLLGALKPYVTPERAKAIEAMLIVSDLFGGMKRG